MLKNQDTLDSLAAAADEAEKSRSSYWEKEVRNFTVTQDGVMSGSTTLGNASEKVSLLRNLAHSLLQFPLRRFAAEFPSLKDSERLGRLIARRQNRQFTYDMLRQCFTLALVRHYLSLESNEDCNLVIGDGYGVMAALLLLHAPHRRTIIVNLTKSLLLDLIYISKAVPGVRFTLASSQEEMEAALADNTIQLIAVRADDADCIGQAAIGLAVNVVSMQEMDAPVINNYFRILRNNKAPETAFYCCNRLYKITNFEDYPWHNSDRVLHDSPCGWSQWSYGPRPPFWIRRQSGKKLIWHRLAILQKEST